MKLLVLTRRRNPELLVFLDARSTLNLENGLRQLIRSRDAQFWKKDHQDAVLWLATTRSKWLVILDNADDPNMDISPYLPAGEENHIVITSRNPVRQVLAPDSNYEVGKLDPDDSVHLLLSTSRYPNTDVNRRHARDIAVTVHHHSLAIVQAGGYILKNHRLSQYVSILNKKRDQLLSKKHIEQPNYPLAVYASFQLSFDLLPQVTQDILWVFSFLNSAQIDETILIKATATSFIEDYDAVDTIPQLREKLEHAAQQLKTLFCPSGEWDSDEFSQSISLAIQYSLLTVTEVEDGRTFYSVHPLIESFLHDILPADKMELPGLSVRILGSIIAFDQSASGLAFNQQLLPHIEATSPTQSILPVDRYALAKVLYNGGLYREATTHVIIALEQLNEARIPAENTLVLQLRSLNALIWSVMGKYDVAVQIHEEVLNNHIRRFGYSHPRTLVAMNNLAGTLREQGNCVKAAELGEQVLEVKRRVLGDDHPSTLISMNILATTLQNQGEYYKAVKLGEQVLAISRRVSGDEHPNTLVYISNLADSLNRQGNYGRAAELGEQALEIGRRVLGEEHPETLASMSNLAGILSRQGNHGKVADMRKQALEIRIRVLGEEHPDTLTSMNELALTLQTQENYAEAAELGKQVLEIGRRVLGDEHPSTLIFMNNLCITFQFQGNYAKAEEVGEQALEIRRRTLGDEHPDTLTSMSNLAFTFNAQGKYTKSAELREKVLEIGRRVLGDDHPSTLTFINNLALTLEDQGDYTKALDLLKQVAQGRTMVLGGTTLSLAR